MSKMNECNSIETIDRTNVTERTKIWLDEIGKIENHFHEEINQRKPSSKKLSKYVAIFDCIDKILIVLRETSGRVSIISFTSVVGAPVGIASANFILSFSLTTGIVKKLLSIIRNKKKKHNKILMLAKSKLNSIETVISQAMTDMEISHENLLRFLKRKINMRRWKTRKKL